MSGSFKIYWPAKNIWGQSKHSRNLKAFHSAPKYPISLIKPVQAIYRRVRIYAIYWHHRAES